MGEGSREGQCPSLEIFSILSLKMASFSAFWALFLQFIVHSYMDCLKRFRRQKPLLVGNYVVIYAKETSLFTNNQNACQEEASASRYAE